MQAQRIFLDGRIIWAGAGAVDPFAPGVLRGKGVFETMRVVDGEILGWDDHVSRLFRGLKVLGIRANCSGVQLRRQVERVLKANRLSDARMRVSVWKEARRLRTAIVVGYYRGFPEARYQKGFKAVVSAMPRKKTRYSHIKSLEYGVFRAASDEAKQKGCDEALLLNTRGELVEGSRTNVFLVEKDTVYTPSTRCGCLKGITRQAVLRAARREGIPCRITAVSAHRLLHADEAFLTNSLIGVMPLTAVNGKKIGRGRIGPTTRRLRDAYRTFAHSSCPAQSKSV